MQKTKPKIQQSVLKEMWCRVDGAVCGASRAINVRVSYSRVSFSRVLYSLASYSLHAIHSFLYNRQEDTVTLLVRADNMRRKLYFKLQSLSLQDAKVSYSQRKACIRVGIFHRVRVLVYVCV